MLILMLGIAAGAVVQAAHIYSRRKMELLNERDN